MSCIFKKEKKMQFPKFKKRRNIIKWRYSKLNKNKIQICLAKFQSVRPMSINVRATVGILALFQNTKN